MSQIQTLMKSGHWWVKFRWFRESMKKKRKKMDFTQDRFQHKDGNHHSNDLIKAVPTVL